MQFSFNFAENVAKRSKTQVSYAWLLLPTFLASVPVVLNENLWREKIIVCYTRAFQMTLDFNNRSNFEFQ